MDNIDGGVLPLIKQVNIGTRSTRDSSVGLHNDDDCTGYGEDGQHCGYCRNDHVPRESVYAIAISPLEKVAEHKVNAKATMLWCNVRTWTKHSSTRDGISEELNPRGLMLAVGDIVENARTE